MVALFDTQKAVEKLRGSGVPEGEAAATVEVVAEVTDGLVTKEYLREQLALMEARQREQHSDLRAEMQRVVSVQTLVIIGTMTAIMVALTQL